MQESDDFSERRTGQNAVACKNVEIRGRLFCTALDHELMSLVVPMLTAMVRSDADALVLTDGSVPVMLGAGGARDVGTHGMRRDVLVAVLKDVLPMHLQRAFDEVGVIKFAVPALTALPGHRFTVVASIGARLRVHHAASTDETHSTVAGAGPSRDGPVPLT